MDSYATLKQSRNMDIAYPQQPSYIQWKNQPLSKESAIASNIAGITRPNPQPSIDRIKERMPVGENPYEYIYQSCCGIIVPKSKEYQATKEIIMAP